MTQLVKGQDSVLLWKNVFKHVHKVNMELKQSELDESYRSKLILFSKKLFPGWCFLPTLFSIVKGKYWFLRPF